MSTALNCVSEFKEAVIKSVLPSNIRDNVPAATVWIESRRLEWIENPNGHFNVRLNGTLCGTGHIDWEGPRFFCEYKSTDGKTTLQAKPLSTSAPFDGCDTNRLSAYFGVEFSNDSENKPIRDLQHTLIKNGANHLPCCDCDSHAVVGSMFKCFYCLLWFCEDCAVSNWVLKQNGLNAARWMNSGNN